MHDTGWIKSTRSTAASDNCVEVRITDTATDVRDSKNRDAGQLSFGGTGFGALLRRVGR
jgi:hypothetical protein